MASVEQVWAVTDAWVARGRFPGYVSALRIGDEMYVRAGGHVAIDPKSAPMNADTRFRIASLTKPIGGALALSVVRDGALSLDDDIAHWLPEIADLRVLVAPDAPLDRTVEHRRPITVRHLLTSTSGWGVTTDETPLRTAMLERGVHPGPLPPPLSADEFVARLAELPLAFQPGDGWLYDTSIDVLGVVLARATRRPLAQLLAERITGPLGMHATGFGTDDVERLATAYVPGPDGLEVLDPPDGLYAQPPQFEKLAGGLVSSAGDVMRFFAAMADGGASVLQPDDVAAMTAPALTDAQRRMGAPVLGPGGSWGYATGVDAEIVEPWMAPGRWGWEGGTGTTAHVDPMRDTVGVLLTQRAMTSPLDGFDDFWAAVAQATRG